MARRPTKAAPPAKLSPVEVPRIPSPPDPALTYVFNPDFSLAPAEGVRNIHAMSRTHLVVALAAALFAIVGVAFGLSQLDASVSRQTAAEAAAVFVQAQIVSQRLEDYDRDLHDRFFVTYRFSAPDAAGAPTVYERERPVDRATYDWLVPGRAALIKYAPGNPAASVLAAETLYPLAIEIYVLLIAVPLLVGVAGLAFGFWRSLQETVFERLAQVLSGEVVSCTGQLAGGAYYVTLRYKFTTPGGKVIQGLRRAMREDLRNGGLPPAGAPVAVLYVNDYLFKLV
jgi:hypothetical protein